MSESRISKPRRSKKANNDAPNISKAIRELRIEAGLTQAFLAKQTGLSLTTISRIEKGDMRISARKLIELLSFFDVELTVTGEVGATNLADDEDKYAKW